MYVKISSSACSFDLTSLVHVDISSEKHSCSSRVLSGCFPPLIFGLSRTSAFLRTLSFGCLDTCGGRFWCSPAVTQNTAFAFCMPSYCQPAPRTRLHVFHVQSVRHTAYRRLALVVPAPGAYQAKCCSPCVIRTVYRILYRVPQACPRSAYTARGPG